ncbi:hypothetical protein [Amycolatopsis sp. NPDC004079]|uniref:endonuclease/exonuclease/phosphatase family protein n=1 Tax=Amycolatopsis sp. NPDC004079 TaxID=3154549 RepID=UPI0033A76F05
MAGLIRAVSWNLLDYGRAGEDPARIERVHQVIIGEREAARAEGDAVVLAVQELIAAGEDKARLAGRRLRELGEATGLCCDRAPNTPAVAVGNLEFHTGLLWTDGLDPVGGWAEISGVDIRHSLAMLHFDVGTGQPVMHASYHAPPWGKYRRADEAERVAAAMTLPGDRPPGLVGGDWNAPSADRVLRRGWVTEDDLVPDERRYYDDDPFRGTEAWDGQFVHQTRWKRAKAADLRWASRTAAVGDILSWRAEREPGEILAAGGLRDVAAELNHQPWTATTGHWNGGADPYPPRRIDRWHVTGELLPALVGYRVIDSDLALAASDHLPVVAVYDPRLVSGA